MPARIAVVSAANRFQRWSDRAEIHAGQLPHRSANVLLFDSRGRVVFQRRSPAKAPWADAWELAVSGHVDEEEYHAGPDDELEAVYERVALREAREELGIDVAGRLTWVACYPPEPGVHYEHLALYRAVHDGPYVLQVEEVAEVRAFTWPEWRAFVASGARVTASLLWLLGRAGLDGAVDQ